MKRHTFAATLTLGATIGSLACFTTVAQAALPLTGTNLSGAEWNVNTGGVTRGGFHVYPDPTYAPGYESPAVFAKAGMTIFRFPIDWENVQPALNGPFDQAEFQKLQTTVSDLTALGVTVLIDLHNYGRYDGNTVGSAAVPNSALADFWNRMAQAYANDPLVAFDLMNEPHDMPTEQWAGAANAAIAAIRAAGAKNVVFVEGNGWTGAQNWANNWYGTPDAVVMLTIADPADNLVFEAHQYLDPDATGGGDTCPSPTIGSERMQPFTDWLRQNHKRGFLGEFNGGANSTCTAALTDLLDYLDKNADVYVGFTWWASGPKWGDGLRVLEPGRSDYAGYMNILGPHLGGSGTLAAPGADNGAAPSRAGVSTSGTATTPSGDTGATTTPALTTGGAAAIDAGANNHSAAPGSSTSSSSGGANANAGSSTGCSAAPGRPGGDLAVLVAGAGALFGRRRRSARAR